MKSIAILIFSTSLAWSAAASADINTIWVNNAGNNVKIQEFDLSGNLLKTINAPHGSNGRGIVQVGDIIYYTSAGTNSVFAYNFKTDTDLGTLFSIPGTTGLATMAYDGTNFYLGDYSGTNKVYKYSPNGTALGVITLLNCGGNCDGLEYVNGTLISNRGDANNIYDKYDLSGNLIKSDFITGSAGGSTGIAFDGTFYYTDNVYGSSFNEYDLNGVFVKTVAFQGGTLGEDLSVNYAARIDTGGVPEAATWAMMLSGFGLVGTAMRSYRRGAGYTIT